LNPTKEEAKQNIARLVERFSEHVDEYRHGSYNEHQTRVDYINPFFKALGWDMDNEQGFAEAYREVIHEDKVKVGGATKAPDYAFTLFGQRKFFVDAKKPSIHIKDDMAPAYQVRRYGWSAKVPIAVVTDFEEFAIYDCSKKPKPTDKASVSRIKYITYDQYLDEFDFLWDIFAKENLPKGRFDKFVKSDTAKKGTTTVDDEFLKSIESWRTYLATGMAWKNRMLGVEELNYAVQKIIDRIIFLRMCEDRGVESYGNLQKATAKGDVYANLFVLFRTADEKYNSGLFDFGEDTLTPGLKIDNKTLKIIIRELYYPECEYEFSVMPADILGSVYERFLGKTIRLTPAHHAKIEEKPEVRKAGGVYYTPKYIVDYIVENTVGKLVEGKTPGQVEKLKICDPACGSGSFLIGAYQFLLDWHLRYYLPEFGRLSEIASSSSYNRKERDKAVRDRAKLPLSPDGKLTTALKKQILLNNIYGVDIDSQAVEVTKLNLLLKALEGETASSITTEMTFGNRVLPNLANNIKCGNSLIGPDFYDTQMELFPDQIKKINAFDWEREFPEVFKEGGFDGVIGNPPYVMLQNMDAREIFDYALKRFNSAKYKIDTYQLFIEQSIRILKHKGFLGYITPNTYLKNIHSEPLRALLLEETAIRAIVLFNYSVFRGASVDVSIGIFQLGTNKSNKIEISISKSPDDKENIRQIDQELFKENERLVFNVSVSETDDVLICKIINHSEPLGTYCKAYFGIQTYDRKKYVSNERINENYKYVIDGGNIHRYYLSEPVEFVNFIPEAIKSGGDESVYLQDKIGIRQIGQVPIATIIPGKIFALNTLYNVYFKAPTQYSMNFLLAVINSKVNQFIWRKTKFDEKKTFPKIKKEAILSIPIPMIDFDNEKDKLVHDSIDKLVANLFELNIELRKTQLHTHREQLQRTIEHTERKIDELVYGLYGLGEEEIGVIENN